MKRADVSRLVARMDVDLNLTEFCAADGPWRASGPFARGDWFALHVDHVWNQPLLLPTARCGEVRVCLPLLAQDAMWLSAASWYSFATSPLYAGPCDADRRFAALTVLLRALRRRVGRLTLAPITTHDGQDHTLRRALVAAGWRVHASVASWRHALDVGGRHHAAYLASRPGALRSTIRRRQAALDCVVTTRFDPQAWAQYQAVHAASWKGAEGSPAFLRAFAEQEGAAGRLRLGLARTKDPHGALPAGAVVAAQLWTVEDGTAYIHKLSQRRDADALSPGSVLTDAMMRHVIDRDRVRTVDFGTGDDRYKADWMDSRDALMRLDAFDLARPSAWIPWARSAASAARARLRAPSTGSSR